MTSAIEFKYINPELYRHPLEREAKKRLDMIPGYKKALDMMSDGSGMRAERQAEIASMVRVGRGVYGQLSEVWNGVQNQFGLSSVPLHIAYDCPMRWSLRGGNDHPSVVIDARLLDELPEREMQALLSMQAGSIRLGNATYLAATDFVRWFSDFSGIAGAPAAMLAWGLENWRRYAMFSADRAASLSVGDPEAVLALLQRISGAGSDAWGGISEPDQLRIQGIEAMSLQKDWSNTRLQRFAMAMNRQNNVALIRRLDLTDWFSGGNPARILAGQMTEPEPPPASGSETSDTMADDPGLAYWGEFASAASGEEEGCKAKGCPMMELMGMAEKGVSAFWKAGSNFLKTFQDNTK